MYVQRCVLQIIGKYSTASPLLASQMAEYLRTASALLGVEIWNTAKRRHPALAVPDLFDQRVNSETFDNVQILALSSGGVFQASSWSKSRLGPTGCLMKFIRWTAQVNCTGCSRDTKRHHHTAATSSFGAAASGLLCYKLTRAKYIFHHFPVIHSTWLYDAIPVWSRFL